MQALLVIDAQNEFSSNGLRPVGDFELAMEAIFYRVADARTRGWPIAWVRHYNRPEESKAFMPGSWGAEFVAGMGPLPGRSLEMEFAKEVHGAFTGSVLLRRWLSMHDVNEILLVGFYTHGCLSTTAREAITLDYKVSIDPDATAACELSHEILGRQSAVDVKVSALLHLVGMGARITPLRKEVVEA